MIQIQINIEEKADEIAFNVNKLCREDATKKEALLAGMYESMSVEFMQILKKSGIIEIIKARVINDAEPTNTGEKL